MRVLFFIVLFISTEAYAMKFKLRAREHFESHTIDIAGTEAKYKGLSNTINFWWEMPYELYYGFYATPVISSLEEESSGSPLGKEIVLYSVGLAAKYFVHKIIPNTYGRLEFGYAELDPDGTIDNEDGTSILLGIGYEHPFEMFGLAVELALRHTALSGDISIRSFTPSIGFHFYEVL